MGSSRRKNSRISRGTGRNLRRGAIAIAVTAALAAALILVGRPISRELLTLAERVTLPTLPGTVVAAAAARLDAGDGAPAPREEVAPIIAAADPFAADPLGAELPAADPPGAPTEAEAAPADPAPRHPAIIVAAQAGDTAVSLLTRAGIGADDAQAAIRKLSSVWDPRSLKPGQRAAVYLQADRLLSVRLALAPGREIVVARDDSGGFTAEDQERPTHAEPTLGSGVIASTLSEAGNQAGVPISVVEELIHAFSYDVDFQREIKTADSFTMLYSRIYDEFDEPAGVGRLMYGELVLSGKKLQLYRFVPSGGEPGYFTAAGISVKKALLRTPIDGARITSGFGVRFHPILGYTRMHRGVDFGAPSGTRVYAAGDGTLTQIGWSAGYGNYIEIDHNRQYATGYGHLSAFAQGLREGSRVKQGAVIGYVGMTGLATGPHLHYEVHYRGEQINPLAVKMPSITRLAGKDMAAFENARRAVDRELLSEHPVAARPEAVRPEAVRPVAHAAEGAGAAPGAAPQTGSAR